MSTSATRPTLAQLENASEFVARHIGIDAADEAVMLQAIGEPELVDTRSDARLSRIFANKMLRRYPAFRDLYGMEEVIEHIVSYFRHAAQGLGKGEGQHAAQSIARSR